MGQDFLTADVEQVVLSDIFRDEDAANVALSLLRPEQFLDPRCRRVFEACQALESTQKPIDLATIHGQLAQDGHLDSIGGLTWLTSMWDMGNPSNVRAHCRIIIADYLARSAAVLGQDIVTDVSKGVGNISDYLSETQSKLTTLINESSGMQDDFRPMMDVALEASVFVDKLHAGGSIGISKTGLRNLDEKIGALRPKDYVIIAGRTSMGKTALATKIVSHIAEQNIPVAFFSLEMGDVPLVVRMACAKAKRSLSDVLKGISRPDDLAHVSAALATVSQYPVFWDKMPAMNPAGLRIKCEKAVRQHKAKVIVLDYIQLMNGPKKAENREKEVAAISRTCKGIARDLDVCFIGLSQLKRNGDQRPSLSDLRDSGALEQDADIVLFPWREIPKDPTADTSPALIDVAKQRNGPIGDCHCQFHMKAVSFENEGYDG